MRLDIHGEYIPNPYQLRLLHNMEEDLPDCRVLVEMFNSSARVRVTDRITYEFTEGYISNVEDDEDWDNMLAHVMNFFSTRGVMGAAS
jgi:uncharacterized iron-regulated protein